MWVLGRNLPRGQVQDDGLREHGLAVLVAAVDLDLVRSLSLEPRRLQSQHYDSAKWRWEALADEGVEARAEDVDKAVWRRFGGVGEQSPIEPHLRPLSTGE